MSKITEDIISKYKDNKTLDKFYYQLKDTTNHNINLTGIINPLKIDNRQLCSPTDNQYDIPMCAGISICSIFESLIWKHTGKLVNLDAQAVYAEAKKLDNNTDDGTYLESAIKAIIKLGNFGSIDDVNIQSIFNDGTYNIIEKIKFLVHKYDFVHVGMSIDSSWYDCTNQKYVIQGSGIPVGGHAMVIVGYDSTGLYIQNSWGANWGASGFCICPWNVVLKELIYVSVFDVTRCKLLKYRF